MKEIAVRIDEIIWHISDSPSGRSVQPICPKHNLRIYPITDSFRPYLKDATFLKCEDCTKPYQLPRRYGKEKEYVLDRIDSTNFKKMKVINLDDEAVPLAKEKIKSDDGKYFVTSLLTESKTGLRLVVYAGIKGDKKKTQIFVEPDIKRIAFDQKDLHPTEVFTSLEATFTDGTKNTLEKRN